MGNALDKLTIKGFKSIKSVEDSKLESLNVLIGGNGAGKSNFIDFFRLLRAMMGLSLPGLKSANLKSKHTNDEKVRLYWKQQGSDYPMRPHLFSDGALRFICLTTALLQPDPPSTMIIDEPELGLYPYAIEILAELIEAASKKSQLIISTQSPTLVDYFNPDNIIVVVRENGESKFKRLNTAELAHWLDDYSLGDLWRKNVIAGGPVHE